MFKISVVIPAYNSESFIASTLKSVQEQSYTNLELVVVDDHSGDSTVDIVNEHANFDTRIKVIENPENTGTMIARKIGTLAASGDYITYLDADDELTRDACMDIVRNLMKHPVDILHFGVTIPATKSANPQVAADMKTFMTPQPRVLTGEDILDSAFTSAGYDWNLAHKVFRADLIQEAMSKLPDIHLTRSEDACAYFIAAAFANTYRSLSDSDWYIYHFGRGISLDDTLSSAKFEDICLQDKTAAAICCDFVKTQIHSSRFDSLQRSCLSFQQKLTEHSMNEWQDNVADKDKSQALLIAEKALGSAAVTSELYRFLRDAAYSLYISLLKSDQSAHKDAGQHVESLRKLIISTGGVSPSLNERGVIYKEVAERHLKEERELSQIHQAWLKPSIKIFTTTHKRVDTPLSKYIQRVQVGPGLENNRYLDTWHDDDGENISSLNLSYCELTTQYWAWKNINSSYYGFQHYRRYFNFSNTEFEENDYGEVMDDYIDADAIKKYGLDDDSISKAIAGYDVITTRFQDLRKVVDQHETPLALYKAAPLLHLSDLRKMYDILIQQHPDYKEDADKFLNGNYSCFCNMFIMRKDIFNDYCEWLFPILEEYEKTTDMSLYSREAVRTPGHLGERLLNIYIMHHKRINSPWKYKELQCVHFTNPEQSSKPEPLTPAETQNKQIIPVVFAADNNYVPMLTTTINSLLVNGSQDFHYDICIFAKDISAENQKTMTEFFNKKNNATLRFINVQRWVSQYKLSTNNAHIGIETYYRFLIQELLPFYDKVLYLDSDLVINGDVSRLFTQTTLGNNLLAAVSDIDYLGNLNIKGGERKAYSTNVLRLKNPYGYFQAGVLLLNTREMRQLHSIEEWLQLASNTALIYNDQDVLNSECQGRVTYLDAEWNVMHNLEDRVNRIFAQAPASNFDAYLDARNHPQIIHYAGYVKPWTDPKCEFATTYWKYARETPFYEQLLSTRRRDSASQSSLPPRIMKESNPLRRVLDPVFPIGSKRREVFKKLARR